MKKMRKRLVALLMTILMVFSVTISVYAAESDDGYTFENLGNKTAEQLVRPGQYEVTVSVPGALETEEYSEIIVMVDASSSQGENLNKLKEMLVNLAEEVLHNDGSMRLTLMGFGMGPRRVGSFYNARTLEAYLAGVTQADLRQGVSATNCEAALQFVKEYIDSSEKLGKTFVIFTSDGMTNMDETPFALSDWKEHPEWWMSGASIPMIGSYAAGGQADLLMQDGTILTPTADLYPAESLALAVTQQTYGIDSEEYKALVDDLYNKITATEEAVIAYTEALWKDIFTYSGLTFGSDGLYSTSKLEKAFLDYHDGIATNSFLCTIHGMKNASFYPDWYNLNTWGARAAAAADALADHDKVLELYMMDFASKNKTWMNPDAASTYHCTSDKISYNTAKSFAAAVDKIETLSDEMFVTVYKDATVTDPMSKWVTLDPSSIRIYKNDLLIYRYGEGWLYEDEQPAANPITLKMNENGRYEITWRIKDGNLLYTDRYFLKYVVDVDETAEGFQYDTNYPANDPTSVTYKDAKGEEQTADIKVPEVKEPTAREDFDAGDKGFKIYKGSSIDGTPISGIQFDVYKVVLNKGEMLNPQPTEEEYTKYMTQENFVGSVVTDVNGYGFMNLTDLGYDDGFYLIVEQPDSKVKAPVAPFYASIPMLDPETGEELDIIEMYPKNEPVVPENPIEPDIPVEPDKPETGRITILKHGDEGEDVVLKGAQFQVYRLALADETPVMTVEHEGQSLGLVPVIINGEPVMIITDKDGLGMSAELDFGLYFLVETKAPSGYNLLENPVPVFVNATSHEVECAVKIVNIAGALLPETGGMGTTVFTMAGMILMLGAGVLLVTRRRLERQ